MYDESKAFNWDDFKAEQRKLQRSEATTCPYCYTPKEANKETGKIECPNPDCPAKQQPAWDDFAGGRTFDGSE